MDATAETVIETCNERIDEIAEHFFGPPKRRDRRGNWRWSGGIEVATAGRHAGCFIVWGGSESGDGIGLVRFAANLEFPEALRWAAAHFGLPLDDRPLSAAERRRIKAATEQRRQAAERERARSDKDRIAEARALWGAAT